MDTTQTTLAQISPGDLRPSKTNPRKRFSLESLNDLAASISAQGIRQPILVRPKAAGTPYEIVAGERRYRAAQIAGLARVPVLISPMDDREALEVQVVENLQRSDLTEMEEAESYRAMLDLREGEKPIYTAELLAARFGKERSHVYRRLALLRLIAPGREALDSGKLAPSTAVLVARIPSAESQAEALEQILAPKHKKEPLSVIEARELVARSFLQSLVGAPFKLQDAELVASAGPCSTCPKMSDNCAALFTEEEQASMKKKKVCTDPACYRAKLDAAWRQKTAKAVAEGKTVLDERASEAIFSQHCELGGMIFGSPYVLLTEKPSSYELKPEVAETVGTWGALIEAAERETAEMALQAERQAISRDESLSREEKKAALAELDKNPPTGMLVPRLIARDQAGAAREIVEKKLAIMAIEESGERLFLAHVAAPRQAKDDFSLAKKKEAEAAQLRTHVACVGLVALHTELVKGWVAASIWDGLFECALKHAGGDGLWLIGKWAGLKFNETGSDKAAAVTAWAATLSVSERQALTPLLLIAAEMKWSGVRGAFEALVADAKLPLDVVEIEREAKKELHAAHEAKLAQKKEKKEAASSDKKPAAPKPKKRSKAEELAEEVATFGWNDIAANRPIVRSATGKLPEGVKCEIHLARAADGQWRYGYDLESRTAGKAGARRAVLRASEGFKTADRALVHGFTHVAGPFFADDPAALRVVVLDADPDYAESILKVSGPA